MRSIFFSVFTVFISSLAYCQKCVVANRENIIYVGISNHLDVAVNGYLCKDITLSTDNGKIESTDNICSYFISPNKIGTADIVITSKTTKNKIGNAVFRVKEIPAPVAMVAGKNGGEIRKNIFKAQIAISAELLNMNIEAKYIIERYAVVILRNEKAVFVKNCNDVRFPQEVKDVFNKLETNDRVIFSDISCRSVNNKITTLQPIEFKIID